MLEPGERAVVLVGVLPEVVPGTPTHELGKRHEDVVVTYETADEIIIWTHREPQEQNCGGVRRREPPLAISVVALPASTKPIAVCIPAASPRPPCSPNVRARP